MKRIFYPVLLAVLVGLIYGFSSLQELGSNIQIIREQWGRSPHAMSMDTEEERIRMNTPECAHCHTAQGYWEVILGRKDSSAPYEDPVGLSCITCHFPEKIAARDGALRVGRREEACTGCHDILVQNDAGGFSSCLQGAMLRGAGGDHFTGTAYKSGTHGEISGGCVGCHMAPTPEGEYMYYLGGHSVRVISKGKVGRHFNPAGCRGCHEEISLESIEKSQQKVRKLMGELKSLLPEFKDPDSGETIPRFPKDPTLTAIQSKASYNYYFILKDGTWGVHNPIYIPQLLKSSIAALKKETEKQNY